MIDELAAVGANIASRQCNIADKISVEKLVTEGLVGKPAIRGVVHGTMVLRMSCLMYVLRAIPISIGRPVLKNNI